MSKYEMREHDPKTAPFEGDKTTWHIRLYRSAVIPTPTGDMTIETWQLWNGDTPESSSSPKEFVQQWRDEELKKLARKAARKAKKGAKP